MKKGFVFVVLALLSLSLVSAYSTYYDVDKVYTYKEKIVETKYYPSRHQTYSKTTYIDYDNDNRYSTEEYKYGFTYRATTDYRDKHYSAKDYYKDYDGKYQRSYRDYWGDSKDYYYEYVPHLREYQKRGCYHEAPKGKLFYIKC